MINRKTGERGDIIKQTYRDFTATVEEYGSVVRACIESIFMLLRYDAEIKFFDVSLSECFDKFSRIFFEQLLLKICTLTCASVQ
jgi:hypothetical protein